MRDVDDRFDQFLNAPAFAPVAGHELRATRRWKTAFAVAAAALVGVSLWSHWGPTSRPTAGAAPAAADEFVDGVVARVRRKIDCDWSDDRWAVATSTRIAEGQIITLDRGLLVLEFQSGAEVTSNGLASLVATSGTRKQKTFRSWTRRTRRGL